MTKGFLASKDLVYALETTARLRDVKPEIYDLVHVAGGLGAVFDLYPNDDVGRILEHFWSTNKVIGTICHGSIALANTRHEFAGSM